MPATESVSLRLSPEDRVLIDRGAKAKQQSRTEFMLESARAAATDAILDQTVFFLAPAEFDAFMKTLDGAPSATEVMEKLKKRNSPWTVS